MTQECGLLPTTPEAEGIGSEKSKAIASGGLFRKCPSGSPGDAFGIQFFEVEVAERDLFMRNAISY